VNVSSESATVQQVLAQHLNKYRETHPLSARQHQVCNHLLSCRTAAMGGVELACDACGHRQTDYFACRDRHCPNCQYKAALEWCEKQKEALLPVTYHHVVFTLPHTLNGWVALHPAVIYRCLFSSVWSTLKHFGENARKQGGQLGVSSVLHTWGENLSRHVHCHCLIPGGVLTEGGQWSELKGDYLFAVRALSRKFRGAMVSALRQAYRQGLLSKIESAREVDTVLDELMGKEWVVYSKPCGDRSASVIDYLGRYTHRVAISNQRIVSVDANNVKFTYKEYQKDGSRKTMTLAAEEFIRRLMMHVVPKGLMRVRHYGFLSNRNRRQKTGLIREQISQATKATAQESTDVSSAYADYRCRLCKKGLMTPIMPESEHGPPKTLMH